MTREHYEPVLEWFENLPAHIGLSTASTHRKVARLCRYKQPRHLRSAYVKAWVEVRHASRFDGIRGQHVTSEQDPFPF